MRERSGARRARTLPATITAGLIAVLIAGCAPQEDLALNAPNADGSTAMLVAGALAKAFPCTDSLESKK